MYISSKTIARLAVIQTVYILLFNKESNMQSAIDNIKQYYSDLSQIHKDLQPPKDVEVKLNTKYYMDLFNLHMNNVELTENILQDFFSPQKKDIPILLKILIQVGVTEAKYLQTPYKIVINEYTNIAAEFFVESYVAFANLVLDRLCPKE